MTRPRSGNTLAGVKSALLGGVRYHCSRRGLGEWFERAGERTLWVWAALEASVPMLPVECLLVPLTRKTPRLAMRFAVLASAFSAFGAFYGYAIGHWIKDIFFWDDSLMASGLFGGLINAVSQWGESLVFLAVLLPFPLFLFCIVAGLLHAGLLPFLCTVLIGRVIRFYLVTSFTVHFHKKKIPC